jgi:hypothetical protein
LTQYYTINDINDNDHNEETMVRCGTTQGEFAIHLHRQWSPQGYDRDVELVDMLIWV